MESDLYYKFKKISNINTFNFVIISEVENFKYSKFVYK